MSERLEERTLQGIYPNEMIPTMEQVAKKLNGSFETLAREGEEYTMPGSTNPLYVRQNNTRIQVILQKPRDFNRFWRRVDKVHKPKYNPAI